MAEQAGVVAGLEMGHVRNPASRGFTVVAAEAPPHCGVGFRPAREVLRAVCCRAERGGCSRRQRAICFALVAECFTDSTFAALLLGLSIGEIRGFSFTAQHRFTVGSTIRTDS